MPHGIAVKFVERQTVSDLDGWCVRRRAPREKGAGSGSRRDAADDNGVKCGVGRAVKPSFIASEAKAIHIAGLTDGWMLRRYAPRNEDCGSTAVYKSTTT